MTCDLVQFQVVLGILQAELPLIQHQLNRLNPTLSEKSTFVTCPQVNRSLYRADQVLGLCRRLRAGRAVPAAALSAALPV